VSKAGPWASRTIGPAHPLHVGALGESERVFDIDAEIANLTFDLGMEEIMEVLKLCVVQGVQALNLGVPILAEELERAEGTSEGLSTARA
jgi:hypothetical protein